MSDPQKRHRTIAVENQIASLAGSIRSSERHRQRFLEQASDTLDRKHTKAYSAKVILAFCVALVAVSPLIQRATRVNVPKPPTATQANAEALRHAEAQHMSFDWALVDVFERFRESKRMGEP